MFAFPLVWRRAARRKRDRRSRYILLDTEFTEILRQLHGMWAGTMIVTHSSSIIIVYTVVTLYFSMVAS